MTINNPTKNVYIALGSNLGNRLKNIKDAVLQIEKQIGTIVHKSNLYESTAVGYNSENTYYNCVILIASTLAPEIILEKLLAIENDLGRHRTKNEYEDRPIDLDLILYENLSFEIKTDFLELPHPRFLERDFVLIPLLEIADSEIKKSINSKKNHNISNNLKLIAKFY